MKSPFISKLTNTLKLIIQYFEIGVVTKVNNYLIVIESQKSRFIAVKSRNRDYSW